MRCWGDDYIIYNASTGDTHQISWIAAIVLQKSRDGSVDEAGLADYFSAAEGLALERDSALAIVSSIIASLAKLELIEQVSE